MISNGYIAKSKGTYAECTECYRRILRGIECVGPGASGLINSLNDDLSWMISLLTEISRSPSAELFKKTYQRLQAIHDELKNFEGTRFVYVSY